MISPQDERPRATTGPGFTDAVTFAWGDPGEALYGLARVGIDDGGGSTLALLFEGTAPVAALARSGAELPAGADFASLALPGLISTVRTPLREWTVAFDDGGPRFELTFEALGAPAELDPAEPVARLGGLAGYEQLCRVHGVVDLQGRERRVHCLGQRSRTWGTPDWDRVASARTVAAWLDDGTGVSLAAVRPVGAAAHADEAAWAVLLDPAGNVHVDEPRLSTTYDADGRQRRAGLELWTGEEDAHARRGAGEALCGLTLDLGELHMDAAMFRWHMEGRSGVGRYDIVRRA